MSSVHASPVLNSTPFASQTVQSNVHSARAYPFPDTLSLSTHRAPAPPNPLLVPSPSYASSPPGYRSLPLSESLTMPPAGAPIYPYALGGIDIVDPASQSSLSVFSPSGLPRPSTDTKGFTLTSTHLFPKTSATLVFSSSLSESSYSVAISSLSSLSASNLPSPTWVPVTTASASAALGPTTTVVFSTTVLTSISALVPSSLNPASTSTYTITSTLAGLGGVTTDFVTLTSVLSTETPGGVAGRTVSIPPATITAIVLGTAAIFAFAALWLFCASRRRHELIREAALMPPENHAAGPLDDEILDVEELGYDNRRTRYDGNLTARSGPVMEGRHAGILAALHVTEMFSRGDEGGSTGGVYGSRRGTATGTDEGDDVTRASSPTLPLHAIPSDDPPYSAPLSPPPLVQPPSYQQITHPAPPPSAYYTAPRSRSSPGPDAAAWLGGYSVAPSCTSHYTRSQTLGSGSGSGSVDALTRTRTGSEEPLLGVGRATPEVLVGVSTPEGASSTTAIDSGTNKLGLGSAFGSPAASTYSPSGVHSSLQYDTSASHDGRTASGSGSYGYPRSGTPNSFDILRSVSSQGALSSVYSHGHGQNQGFRFGFSRQGSSSSGSIGKKATNNRHSFGVPPTSFRAWKDWGSATSEKERQGEKPSSREKDRGNRTKSTASASSSGSVDEKQGRGSPVVGVRALLGRLRRAGHTPSPQSSNYDLSPSVHVSMDVDERPVAQRATPPPIQIQAAAPKQRRYSFILSNPDSRPPSPCSGIGGVVVSSEVLPHQELLPLPVDRPVQHALPTCDPRSITVPSGGGELQRGTFPTGYTIVPAPSPVPTEESRLVEGLLHPRLQTQGCSDASLRDFEDYSRPIGGIMKNQLYSTTTFGTQDDTEASPIRGTSVQAALPGDEHEHGNTPVDCFRESTLVVVPRDSWIVEDPPSPTSTPKE